MHVLHRKCRFSKHIKRKLGQQDKKKNGKDIATVDCLFIKRVKNEKGFSKKKVSMQKMAWIIKWI
jgi:hypothetical protein